MAEVTETRQGPGPAASAQPVIGVAPIFTEAGRQHLGLAQPVTSTLRVGRRDGIAVQLDDSQVSREHAELRPAQGGITIADLGSHNGTFVNAERVGASEVLAPVGAVLRCGKTLLTVVEDVELFRRNPPCKPPLVGSARMADIRRQLATVATFSHAVLLLGETGTGKERAAETLHAASGRNGAFIPVNCGAIPQNLVESELFGHTRGAFSGSNAARPGLFRAAEGGTLFLDEIADLPLPAQAKLLRALETGEVRAVGEDRPRIVDTRVITATNANLDEMARAGRFRVDLLHRISAWKIVLPPLRERKEDVPLLAEHFLSEGSPAFSVEVMERMVLWRWPGNVRELRSLTITTAARAATAGSGQILLEHLPPEVLNSTPAASPVAAAPNEDTAFRARVEMALKLRNGNVAQVARDLGCGRPWLYQELKRLDIDVNAFRKR